MDRRTQKIAEAISQFPIDGAKILDVGAGNGLLAQIVMRLRPDIHIEGVDIMEWPETYIPVQKFDGETIPARIGEWDYCLASDVLHHCPLPENLLAEMVRIAGKGVIIKDHIAETALDRVVLSFMDWFGNRGHGVGLNYQYWSSERWDNEFCRNRLVSRMAQKRLDLYPFPFSLIFGRNLHFVNLLVKEQTSRDPDA